MHERAPVLGNGHPSEFDPLPDGRALTFANSFLRFADYSPRRPGEPLTLRHWNDEFYRFNERIYEKVNPEIFLSDLIGFLNAQSVRKRDKHNSWTEMVNVTPAVSRAVLHQLKALCQARADGMPGWLDHHRPPRENVIAFRNGWIDIAEFLSGRQPIQNPPTAYWFSENMIPYDFSGGAGCPTWIDYLNRTFRDDAECVQLLQEYIGYCLTTDNRFQKMLWLVGPPAAGKGTICSVIRGVVGDANCCSPSLSSLDTDFGLEPLLGKSLAIIGDAHLGRKDDPVGVLNTIKTITGNDPIDVNRKNLKALAGVRLPVRFIIGANSLPTLPDISVAIRRRALMLPFEQSHEGKEDSSLADKFARETPGIIAWALDGLKSLRLRGCFVQPAVGEELVLQMARLASPLRCYVEERCIIEDGAVAPVDDLYDDYKKWGMKNGHSPLSKERFGADLKQVVPYKKIRQRDGDRRPNAYQGLRLELEAEYQP